MLPTSKPLQVSSISAMALCSIMHPSLPYFRKTLYCIIKSLSMHNGLVYERTRSERTCKRML